MTIVQKKNKKRNSSNRYCAANTTVYQGIEDWIVILIAPVEDLDSVMDKYVKRLCPKWS